MRESSLQKERSRRKSKDEHDVFRNEDARGSNPQKTSGMDRGVTPIPRMGTMGEETGTEGSERTEVSELRRLQDRSTVWTDFEIQVPRRRRETDESICELSIVEGDGMTIMTEIVKMQDGRQRWRPICLRCKEPLTRKVFATQEEANRAAKSAGKRAGYCDGCRGQAS
jgi:hypothetical protein